MRKYTIEEYVAANDRSKVDQWIADTGLKGVQSVRETSTPGKYLVEVLVRDLPEFPFPGSNA